MPLQFCLKYLVLFTYLYLMNFATYTPNLCWSGRKEQMWDLQTCLNRKQMQLRCSAMIMQPITDTVEWLFNRYFRDFLIPFKLMQDAYFTAQWYAEGSGFFLLPCLERLCYSGWLKMCMFQEYPKELFYPSHPLGVAIGFLCHNVVDFDLFTFQITMFLLLLFTENNKVNYY